jgi:hypothetical protein
MAQARPAAVGGRAARFMRPSFFPESAPRYAHERRAVNDLNQPDLPAGC